MLELVHETLAIATEMAGTGLMHSHPGKVLTRARVPQPNSGTFIGISFVLDVKTVAGRTKEGADAAVDALLG